MKKILSSLFSGTAVILISLCVILVTSAMRNVFHIAEKPYLSIKKIIDSCKVEAEFKGLGGYQGGSVELNLKNPTTDTLRVWIEPGRKLIAKDSSFQDIFIVKEKKFKLSPKEKIKVLINGFCCRATRHAPAKDAKFSVGYMTPPNWQSLAKLINKNDFPAGAIQAAVWLFSNTHSIASISDADMKRIQPLRGAVANLTKDELTWYTITYKEDPQRVFSDEATYIRGMVDYYVRSNTMVTVLIRAKNGRLMRKLPEWGTVGSGKYSYEIDIDVVNWPKGEYTVFIYEDESILLLKKSFKI